MIFSSFEFALLFLPIAAGVFWRLRAVSRCGERLSLVWLVVASWFFYGWWKVDFLPVLLGSIVGNLLLSRHLGRPGRGWLLVAGVVANLLALGYFKYRGFVLEQIDGLLATNLAALAGTLVLPLGISFFTFQQIAYLVDVHRGEGPRSGFWDYALFISFFPQLIAGPIVHHREMMPQFAALAQRLTAHRDVAVGIYVFAIGLSKKVLLADTFGIWANAGYQSPDALSMAGSWVATLSYTLQIYFDFSGYCDMATGAARMFGIRLPDNFASPYKARSVRAFWRRWHITLGRWLRDYLYIPLGGNRHGRSRELLNLVVTFVLGGFWHGANWTFVIWGFLHGLALVVERVSAGWRLRLPPVAAGLAVFAFVHLTWVFFRADSVGDACIVLRAMVGFGEGGGLPVLGVDGWKLGLLGLGLGIVWLAPNSLQMRERFRPDLRRWLFALLLVEASLVRLCFVDNYSEFLYFDF